MLINAMKTKVLTNSEEILEIMVNGEKLEQVDSFTYLGSNVRKDAECTGEVKSRFAVRQSARMSEIKNVG